jgi:hypothetical protein
MATSTLRTCPSCKTRLSPLAAECPECGLALAPPRQGRPLLFQASALARVVLEPPSRALTAPALGRVATVAVEVSPDELERPYPLPAPTTAVVQSANGAEEPAASFWPLVKVEITEAVLLILVQGLALLLPSWLLGISPVRLLLGAWPLIVPYLVATSWLFFMGPLVLTGQSPMMGTFGVTLPENTPERRMTFSLVHLISVACFPLSFCCMVLSPRHQTLAELLSGQELLSRPTSRLR